MLIWERIKNTLESIGYARAASQLAAQGYYNESKYLYLEKSTASRKRLDAIRRLEKVKKAKADYEPGDHYMKGHKVAFWRGHADA
jgi:hypothetical protein